ncbi:hypothetical protein [Nitrosopumilus ureiphilus]|uniref:Uncharacterized protein n=1 Tax=Nitrosopumilus ureiphilus TaxID=1470067 RepID=A0A7D5M9W6_9ARCH|nr:hypothetical protein [Nitrosopumilus ureiphilus]QLH06649.1 hypothetical protein C5F50_05855 [Nitrosopumilus ureiphilus]
MKTNLVIIILGIIITISVIVGGLFIFQSPSQSIQCDVGYLPKAHASLIYSSINDVYLSANVIVVGTIQTPSNGSNFLVNVSEYVKNPRQENMLILDLSYPPSNIINSNEKHFSPNENALLFLNGPDIENKFKIIPYSVRIPEDSMSGKDLIKGIEVRAMEKRLVMEQGQSAKFVLCLDSFFGYNEDVPLRISGFSIYDSSGNGKLYEDPSKLEEFGILLNIPQITAISDKTVSFEVPVHIKDDAMKGRYFIDIEHKDGNSFEELYWKRGSIQLHVFLE